MTTISRAKTRRANWSDIAQKLASDAHRTTTLRRFFGECKVDDFVFAYIGNGNPYANEPNLREAEHQLFREWCKQEKVTILAEASDTTGYTTIIVLDLSDSEADCKRFGEVFNKYCSFAASPQALQLAKQKDKTSHEVATS